MAVTVTANYPEYRGRRKLVTGTITFDSSYPTGGEAVTVAQLGLTLLENLQVQPGLGSTTTAYVPAWDRSKTSPKVQAFMGDNNNASDGPLIEVANTTDLSALIVGFTATGW